MNRAQLRPLAIPVLFLLISCQPGGGGADSRPVQRPASGDPHEVWRWAAPPPSYVGMPVADGTGVAFTSALSRLVVLDHEGTQQWVAEWRRLRDVAPGLTPDLVIAATEDGLVAFDRVSGSLRWSTQLHERTNTPAVAGGLVVTSTWDSSLAALDASSGEVRWRVSLPGPAHGPPAASAQVAVATWVSSDQSRAGVVAVDVADGRHKWAVPLPPVGVSAPVVLGPLSPSGAGMVVVVGGDAAAYGFDSAGGAQLWRTELEGAGSPEVPPLPVAPGKVLFAHRLGGLSLLNAADGRAGWRVSSDGAAVRGGPVGPSPDGRYAFPLDDGRLLLAGPDEPTTITDPPGRVSGLATTPSGLLLIATREAADNGVSASAGW